PERIPRQLAGRERVVRRVVQVVSREDRPEHERAGARPEPVELDLERHELVPRPTGDREVVGRKARARGEERGPGFLLRRALADAIRVAEHDELDRLGHALVPETERVRRELLMAGLADRRARHGGEVARHLALPAHVRRVAVDEVEAWPALDINLV